MVALGKLPDITNSIVKAAATAQLPVRQDVSEQPAKRSALVSNEVVTQINRKIKAIQSS
jgi:hypothetical protein